MSEPDDLDVAEIHEAVLRERQEPFEGREPVPVWMGLAFVLLIAWGGWYLGRYDARFDTTRADMQPLTAAATLDETREGDDLTALGETLYQGRCSACHQANGKGLQGLAPPLDGSEWVTGDPKTATRIVLHGLTGPIEVAGQTWNGAMPAWGTSMSDEEIAAVLTFARSAWSNDAGAISPDEVGETRESDDRSSPWTAAEL